MVKVMYADWDKLGRYGLFDLQHGQTKVTKEFFKQNYVEVAKLKEEQICCTDANEITILNKIWEIFNTRAHEWKVRSMCVGDIVQIGRTKYMVSSFGFSTLNF